MTTVTVRSDLPAKPVPGFTELREELLGLIERLSSAQWTDYNTHDPGITIGEHIAWGVTEDVYTANHPIRDLITLPAGEAIPPHPDFAAERVLPSRASTLLDYRKLLIDVPGVRNAWLREMNDPAATLWHDPIKKTLLHDAPIPAEAKAVTLRGFYHVDVSFEEDVTEASMPERIAVLRGLLESNRNLGEVFLEVVAAPPEEVAVCADIVVTPDANLAEVTAALIAALEEFIAPAPRFHSLAERLAAGLASDEIIEGPLLQHGFLDNDEVTAAGRPVNVRASDLIQVIMDVPGITAVSRITMTGFRDGIPSGDAQPWILPLDSSRAPELSASRSRFTFFKRGLPFHVSEAEYARQLDELRAERRFRRYPAGSQAWPVVAGRHRQVDEFSTLLNLLPLNYGVGRDGLPDDAPLARRAQAMQLKGYFFLAERLLAGHRAQLSRLREILSLRREPSVVRAINPTDLRHFPTLLTTTEADFAVQHQSVTENTDARLIRRHRLADHFLARFGEPFDALSVAASRRPTGDTPESLYNTKSRWLGASPELARDRAAAVNLARPPGPVEEPGTLSGLEAKLLTLLGVPRRLPVNALEIVEEAAGVRFTLRDPGAGVDFAVGVQHHSSRSEAEAAADSALRAATLAGRYGVEAVTDGFRFVLFDECGERAAVGAVTSATAELAAAAASAGLTFFRALPLDPPLYLLEHIHVRPLHAGAELLPACECEPDGDPGCYGEDPYSFRATLVLPAWPARFRSLFYRAHLETIAREFTPAHVFLKICWLDEAQMNAFTPVLAAWRTAQAAFLTGSGPDPAAERDALVRVWRELRSIFPVATLHDCIDGNDTNPVVLDNNTLGTLEEAEP